jgi:hypothetical protein
VRPDDSLLLPTAYCLLPTAYCLLPTAFYSLLTTHYSPLTTHHAQLTTHHSPLTTHHYPLTTIRYPLSRYEDEKTIDMFSGSKYVMIHPDNVWVSIIFICCFIGMLASYAAYPPALSTATSTFSTSSTVTFSPTPS